MYSNEKAHFFKWAFSWTAPNLHVFHPAQQEQVWPRAIFDKPGCPGRPQKTIPAKGIVFWKIESLQEPSVVMPAKTQEQSGKQQT
jgi:hypothetical protein